MMVSLDGKAIIVTGAGGGIGRASALVMAEAGARLVVTDFNLEAGYATLEEVQSLGGEAAFIPADLSIETDVANLIGQAVEKFGSVDGAFNNAGIRESGIPLHELPTEYWEKMIRVNLTSVFWCIKYEIIAMLSKGRGSIVNTSSDLGMMAIPNASDYVAAKHGVIGLTRAAATEYASRGIRTNCILPGVVQTPIVAQASPDSDLAMVLDQLKKRYPAGRFAEPCEIGEAAKWLLSDAASFVNGAAMAVDGGFLAS